MSHAEVPSPEPLEILRRAMALQKVARGSAGRETATAPGLAALQGVGWGLLAVLSVVALQVVWAAQQ